MMVVADTSPLNYLIQLGIASAIQALYGIVLVPPEVLTELKEEGAPAKVSQWARMPPDWVNVRSASREAPAALSSLDPGERAAINLALEVHADLLLIDERKARHLARDRFGFRVTGTLGILRDAHLAGLLDARTTFEALSTQTNFHSSSELRTIFLNSLEIS